EGMPAWGSVAQIWGGEKAERGGGGGGIGRGPPQNGEPKFDQRLNQTAGRLHGPRSNLLMSSLRAKPRPRCRISGTTGRARSRGRGSTSARKPSSVTLRCLQSRRR